MFNLIAILFVISAQANEPVSQFALSFDDLPKLVYERNDHAKAAQLHFEASRNREGYLGRSYLPHVEVGGGAEYFRTGDYSSTGQPFADVTAKVNIFRSGKDGLEESIREYQTQIARAEADTTVLAELTKARRLYWTLVYQREIEGLIEDAMKRNSDSLASTQKRLSAGMGTDTDRIEFEIQKTNLEQDLARVKLEKRNSERKLNVLLGLDSETALLIDGRVPHEHTDRLINEALHIDQHRESRMLAAQKEVSDLSRQIDSRWWAPAIDVYASYGLFTLREKEFENLSDRKEAVVGARLSFNLFDGGISASEADSKRALARSFELKATQSKKELGIFFQGLKDELKLIHELIHGAEKNVDQARSYLSGTFSEYRRGLKNSPDVVGANLRYIDTVKRSAELRRDYQFARVELLEVLGR